METYYNKIVATALRRYLKRAGSSCDPVPGHKRHTKPVQTQGLCAAVAQGMEQLLLTG